MKYLAFLLSFLAAVAKILAFGWIVGLCRLWRKLCDIFKRRRTRHQLPGGRHKASKAPCSSINEKAFTHPDPLIYSQYDLMARGCAVTWDNPGIEPRKGGAVVPSSHIDPGRQLVGSTPTAVPPPRPSQLSGAAGWSVKIEPSEPQLPPEGEMTIKVRITLAAIATLTGGGGLTSFAAIPMPPPLLPPPPPPPPKTSRLEAEQAGDEARRQGMANSSIVGETEGYRSDATPLGSLLG